MVLSTKLTDTKEDTHTHTNLLPNSRSMFKETVVVAGTKENIQLSRKSADLCSGDFSF